jgi:RNase P/RNase MRP subunit p30
MEDEVLHKSTTPSEESWKLEMARQIMVLDKSVKENRSLLNKFLMAHILMVIILTIMTVRGAYERIKEDREKSQQPVEILRR